MGYDMMVACNIKVKWGVVVTWWYNYYCYTVIIAVVVQYETILSIYINI